MTIFILTVLILCCFCFPFEDLFFQRIFFCKKTPQILFKNNKNTKNLILLKQIDFKIIYNEIYNIKKHYKNKTKIKITKKNKNTL